jgi:glycosyltransferase involved in cell wall biosynthesis
MKADQIKISVVIPNFNRGNFLAETLDSLLCQHYTNWEAVVVDDGSTDNSLEVMNKYSGKDNRIKCLVRNRQPSGGPVCRNIGLENSTGSFVIFLDSDDLLAAHCLAQRAEMIQKFPDNDFWVFPMLMFRDNPQNARYLWNKETDEPDLHRFLSLDAVWQTTGPVWRREAVEKINGFTESLACWQDVDFHLKALCNNLRYQKFYHLTPDVFYRMHEVGSISQGEISSKPKLIARKNILISHFEHCKPQMNNVLREKFGILAQSVIFGSAKTLHRKITFSVIRFSVKNKLIKPGLALRATILQLLVSVRINRIPLLINLTRKLFKRRSLDSNIGKFEYIKS